MANIFLKGDFLRNNAVLILVPLGINTVNSNFTSIKFKTVNPNKFFPDVHVRKIRFREMYSAISYAEKGFPTSLLIIATK